MKPPLKVTGSGILIFIAVVAIIVWFCSCSSSKKTINKSESKVDSVSVKTSTVESKKDSAVYKRIDSIGSLIKEKDKTYEVVTEIEYDTVYQSNGSSDDYIPKQRVKKVTIKENGVIKSKSIQTGTKNTTESTNVSKSDKVVLFDSVQVSKQSSETSKTKDSKGLWEILVDKMWLWILLGLIAFAYYNRDYIKKELFGGR